MPRRASWRGGSASVRAPRRVSGLSEAERVARASYGRLVALLAARTRDIAAAEDALSDAFAAALSTWPEKGAPDNPEAWLYAAARRRLIDAARRRETAAQHEATLLLLDEEMREQDEGADPRLGLLFACAHPAIDQGVRTALMLQTVLGFTAHQIAFAFMMEPAALSQRLVRAKAKLKHAGPTFKTPDVDVWPERLEAVLEAIYACYGASFDDSGRSDLAIEALYLSEILAALLPRAGEALGLRALLLHLEARTPARRDETGAYVPLLAQDTKMWRQDLLREGERVLQAAFAMKRVGRFQLEAAIQSAYAARAWRGSPDWGALLVLYDALLKIAPSDVVQLNRVAVVAQIEGPAAGLKALTSLDSLLQSYQPYWALKADLLRRDDRKRDARSAYDRAIDLTPDPVVQKFLRERRDGCD